MFGVHITPSDEVNWNVVDLVITRYAARYPAEILGCEKIVKDFRSRAKTKFAETGGDMNTRHLFEMPARLQTALDMKYPKLFTGKNLITFLKKYRLFCIPEKL